MKDRIPTYPGRRKMIPVEGQPNVYDVEMADVPTQEGTPLNTETLLQNSTAASLGLGDDATPDDAIKALIAKVTQLNTSLNETVEDVNSDLADALSQIDTKLNAKITYGTTDLVAGTSNLATGALYVVYE